MGMSTHVAGFRPPDDKWKKMKAVYDACEAAGMVQPDEVCDFFQGETPDESGVVVELEGTDCCREFNDSDSASDGFEIDIRKLPKDIHIIRFYNSW